MIRQRVFIAAGMLIASFAQADTLLQSAERHVRKQPNVSHHIGLSETYRSRGAHDKAMRTLRNAIKNTKSAKDRMRIREFLLWRMMPLQVAQRSDFEKHLNALPSENWWANVYAMQLALADQNSSAIHDAKFSKDSLPRAFPSVFAEQAHFDLLFELGVSRTNAGLEVITNRRYQTLHALRDIDRAMTREVEFLGREQKKDLSKRVKASRDQLRQTWLNISTGAIERMTALSLMNRTRDRDELLKKLKGIACLNSKEQLSAVFSKLDSDEAWSILIEPLLRNELSFITAPPDLESHLKQKTELVILADKIETRQATVVYTGNVRASVRDYRFTADSMNLDKSQPDVVLTGTGKVTVTGLPGKHKPIRADGMAFDTRTGTIALSGNVIVESADRTIKLTACTLTLDGKLQEQKSLIDDFNSAKTVEARLALLPAIAKQYKDDELRGEARYMTAMKLIRPHLSWHAAFTLKPQEKHRDKLERVIEEQQSSRHDRSRWKNAHRGEPWMHEDVPDTIRDEYKRELAQFVKRPKGEPDFYWRLKDQNHKDIARAIKLLSGVRESRWSSRSAVWIAELRRNNTVITFDIPGGFTVGRDGPLVMDTRNADEVSFRLYRVRDPKDLVPITQRIGLDYMYRDYGLQHGMEIARRHEVMHIQEELQRVRFDLRELPNLPEFTKENLVDQWRVRTSDLETVPQRRIMREWDWEYERHGNRGEDSDYFDDECNRFRRRIEKKYQPNYYGDTSALTTWQCNRIVQVPANGLSKAGAYVLVAESNGQKAHVPLIVDPLSMTMRRNRDGVFVMVSDTLGSEPVKGAQILAYEQLDKATTDDKGAAFAHVFAHGSRTIIAHKDGRYAVGGFGDLFEGVYETWSNRQEELWPMAQMLERMRRAEPALNVYADRHVFAAYTDRPVYRPGQTVQFKLIARILRRQKTENQTGQEFRANEFDATTQLELPTNKQPLRYDIINAKERVTHSGILNLNDFGTAAGDFKLNEESATGSYRMRVWLKGRARMLPCVFAVKHYRRPNFAIELDCVPGTVNEPTDITCIISANYYFGKSVKDARVDVRLVKPDHWRPLVASTARTGKNGTVAIDLSIPATIASSEYVVIASVTDASGRTVTASKPHRINSEGTIASTLVVPRFAAMGSPFTVRTTRETVTVNNKSTSTRNGKATLTINTFGWHTIAAGKLESRVFIYGGKKHPDRAHLDDDESTWVNLTDYERQEHSIIRRRARRDRAHNLLAMFDRQHVKPGDDLRVLVYVPYDQARLLLTSEGRTVIDYQVARVNSTNGYYHVVQLPITKRHQPNFYLQGCILWFPPDTNARQVQKEIADQEKQNDNIGDGSEDPRWCRVDVIDPNAKPGQPKLRIAMQTDRDNYKPGDEVKVRLKVTDLSGNPRAAEVSLGAVDESVYVFGEDRLDLLPSVFGNAPPPRRYMPKAWRSSRGIIWANTAIARLSIEREQVAMQQMAESLQKLQSEEARLERMSELALPTPRLEGEMPATRIPLNNVRLRSDFRETAAWQPQLLTGNDGVINTTFKLPDSLTAYRLSAVGLTKQTEIGIARSELRATLPLSVQLFLPRFAVETDRLRAVALIHNTTLRDSECSFEWKVTGAHVADRAKLRGNLSVNSQSSNRVELWLDMKTIGDVRVIFSAGNATTTDSEQRDLQVHPLGRAVETSFTGQFKQSANLDLPQNFIPSEMSVTLSRGNLGQALSGLQYLVAYPYGCVEQTMSRFLPAVMVKRAVQQSPIELPARTEAQIPAVLAKGLERLYNHQQKDGSWGWFNRNGNRDMGITVYVMYGLARCRATGVEVDDDVFRRGCNVIQKELAKQSTSPDLRARAWYVLSLAGEADPRQFEHDAKRFLQQTDSSSPIALFNLAFAARALGHVELATGIWKKARSIKATNTSLLAMKLIGQIQFGESIDDCYSSADQLLARRHGVRWGHTRDTSWAIEALAQVVRYLPTRDAPTALSVAVDQAPVYAVTHKNKLKRFHHSATLTKLPTVESKVIAIKSKSDEPVHYAVTIAGVQRQDELRPTGTTIQVRRRLTRLDGKPLTGPVAIGDVIAVNVDLELAEKQSYLIIEDRRPAACEFAGDKFLSKTDPANVEFRDDRVAVFFSRLPAGLHTITYYLRAETAAVSQILPGHAYPMYNEKVRGETGSTAIVIK